METASLEVRDVYKKTLRGKPNNIKMILAYRPEMMKNFLAVLRECGTCIRTPAVWCASEFPCSMLAAIECSIFSLRRSQ